MLFKKNLFNKASAVCIEYIILAPALRHCEAKADRKGQFQPPKKITNNGFMIIEILKQIPGVKIWTAYRCSIGCYRETTCTF